MLLCAITDTSQLAGNPAARRGHLLDLARHWAMNGVDLIQLREKHLPPAQLASLLSSLLSTVRSTGSSTRCLLNGDPSVAISAGAHGVHLPSGPGHPTAVAIRARFRSAGLPAPILSIACHTIAEIGMARNEDADFALFAPVFEKPLPGCPPLPGQGTEALRDAAAAAGPMPVLALGGVTMQNARLCSSAGAAGIASIRLFLPPPGHRLPDLTQLRELRTLESQRPG